LARNREFSGHAALGLLIRFFLKTKGMPSPQMNALHLDARMLHIKQEATTLAMLELRSADPMW
jgi:hypothetical protein